MGKEKSLVTVKLTPTSHLELDLTNGFVSWGSISGDSSCRTSPERKKKKKELPLKGSGGH